MARAERGWDTRASQGKGGMGREMQGMAVGWRGGHCRGDSLNNVVTVLARYHMLHAAIKLCLPRMPKSFMSNSKKVREGKSTKGTLAKGHLCAYPIHIYIYIYIYIAHIYIYIYIYILHI